MIDSTQNELITQEINTFKFESNFIREITIEGKPWFVASDVAKTLGYDQPHKAIAAHCKRAISLNSCDGIDCTVYTNQGIDSKAKLIPESDVYRLTMKSKLESAEKFQDWLAEEVIPSIRKTGSYIQTPKSYIAALEALVIAEKEKIRLSEEVAKLNIVIDNEFGYCSILRAAIFVGVSEKYFNWRILKALTLGLGLEVKRVPSPRYEYQNLYPIKAFEQGYPEVDFDGLTPEKLDDKLLLAFAKKP
jgi:prophage antirepressor-like protein